MVPVEVPAPFCVSKKPLTLEPTTIGFPSIFLYATPPKSGTDHSGDLIRYNDRVNPAAPAFSDRTSLCEAYTQLGLAPVRARRSRGFNELLEGFSLLFFSLLSI